MKRLKYLELPNGKVPCMEWINSLETVSRAKVFDYLNRVAAGGGKKNIRTLGDGVFEIKIKFGAGLRVYFAEEGKTILLLLAGGDKSTQKSDIKRAKKYWSEYNV